MHLLAATRRYILVSLAALGLLAVGAYMTAQAFVQQMRGKVLAKGETCEPSVDTNGAQPGNQHKDLFVSCSGFLD